MQLIDVEVQDIELGSHLPDLVEHQQMIGDGVLDGILPKSPPAARHQICAGHRISAGEQGHIVPLRDQLFREVRDDALCSAVVTRRHAFDQRRDLGDTQGRGRCFPGGRTSDRRSGGWRNGAVGVRQHVELSGGLRFSLWK